MLTTTAIVVIAAGVTLSPELMREFYGWRPCDGARPLNGGGRKDVMTRDFTFEEAAANGY